MHTLENGKHHALVLDGSEYPVKDFVRQLDGSTSVVYYTTTGIKELSLKDPDFRYELKPISYDSWKNRVKRFKEREQAAQPNIQIHKMDVEIDTDLGSLPVTLMHYPPMKEIQITVPLDHQVTLFYRGDKDLHISLSYHGVANEFEDFQRDLEIVLTALENETYESLVEKYFND